MRTLLLIVILAAGILGAAGWLGAKVAERQDAEHPYESDRALTGPGDALVAPHASDRLEDSAGVGVEEDNVQLPPLPRPSPDVEPIVLLDVPATMATFENFAGDQKRSWLGQIIGHVRTEPIANLLGAAQGEAFELEWPNYLSLLRERQEGGHALIGDVIDAPHEADLMRMWDEPEVRHLFQEMQHERKRLADPDANRGHALSNIRKLADAQAEHLPTVDLEFLYAVYLLMATHQE